MFGMPRIQRSLREYERPEQELLARLLSWHRWRIWSLQKSKKPSIVSMKLPPAWDHSQASSGSARGHC